MTMNEIPSLPLVSIVLGTYNGQTYLAEQLDAVFAQTYPRLEVIAVDDGSRDDTVRILRDYAARHSNMTVHINETNLGFVKNFEKGAALSTGEWIAFCDQDDYWYPKKVAKMVAAVGSYPMIFCDSELCDEHLRSMGKKISDVAHFQTYDDPLQLCVFSRMYGHATLVSRSLFEKARPFLKEVPHDGWLAYHATLYGGVKYLPEVLVMYRQHPGAVFGAVGGKSRNEMKLTEIRNRMEAYYKACPEPMARQKKVLRALVESYRDFSLWNDIRRVVLFLGHCKTLLTVKKYPAWRKYLFCLKMFVKIK